MWARARGGDRPRLQRDDLRRPRPGGGAVRAGDSLPPRLGGGRHPVVDLLSARAEVDSNRLAIIGVSQAGYWVTGAVSFEKRIAAVVASGVVDVSTAWTEKLPKSMAKLLEQGEREEFERNFRFAEHFMGKTTRQTLAFRMKPYRTESMFDAIQAVRAYRLDEVIGHCEPMGHALFDQRVCDWLDDKLQA